MRPLRASPTVLDSIMPSGVAGCKRKGWLADGLARGQARVPGCATAGDRGFQGAHQGLRLHVRSALPAGSRSRHLLGTVAYHVGPGPISAFQFSAFQRFVLMLQAGKVFGVQVVVDDDACRAAQGRIRSEHGAFDPWGVFLCCEDIAFAAFADRVHERAIGA